MKNKNEKINANKFILNKDNKSYDLIIEKIEDSIYIKCLPYQVKFDTGNISEIFSMNLDGINNEFNFICNLFINKKVEIFEIILNVNIILEINFPNEKIKDNKVYIYLIHPEQNQNFIINKYYNKIKQLENIDKKNKINNNISILLNLDKFNLKFIKNLKAYNINPYYNSFIIFNSCCSNIEYLIFVTKNKNIISYDLNSNQILAEIKQSVDILRLEYIFDKKNKRDLLMIYNIFNFIRIFDVKNWNIILTINNVNDFGLMNSVCFLHYIKDNEYFIITSNDNCIMANNIKVYDFNGKIKKEIKNSNENTFCIKTYYEEKSNKTFIIAINKKWIKSYDFDQNILYKKYNEKKIEDYSYVEIIKTKEDVIQLIASCASYGLILIFNFNTGDLLNKIKIGEKFFTMFLYNEKALFIGTMNGDLILMNLLSKENKIFEKIHRNYICCINTFNHKKEGKCLVTQGNDEIINIYKILDDNF